MSGVPYTKKPPEQQNIILRGCKSPAVTLGLQADKDANFGFRVRGALAEITSIINVCKLGGS